MFIELSFVLLRTCVSKRWTMSHSPKNVVACVYWLATRPLYVLDKAQKEMRKCLMGMTRDIHIVSLYSIYIYFVLISMYIDLHRANWNMHIGMAFSVIDVQ